MVRVIFIFVIFLNYCFAQGNSKSSLEDKVKAAYILNFIRYTDWPKDAFPTSESPLVMCVLSSDTFGNILQQTISVAKGLQRKIELKQMKEPHDSLDQCHVVFLARSYTSKELNLIVTLKQKSILSISDDETFFKMGGIISFVFYEKTIQFNVNLVAADSAGLKLSSRMLALAKNVVKDKNGSN